MRKILLATFIIIMILYLFKSETIIIPKESIRFRVIANSNSEEDQNIKKEVVHDLSEEIKKIHSYECFEFAIFDLTSINDNYLNWIDRETK